MKDSKIESIVEGFSKKIGIDIELNYCDSERKGKWQNLSFNFDDKNDDDIVRIKQKAKKVITSSEYYCFMPLIDPLTEVDEDTTYYIGTSDTGKIEIHFHRKADELSIQ